LIFGSNFIILHVEIGFLSNICSKGKCIQNHNGYLVAPVRMAIIPFNSPKKRTNIGKNVEKLETSDIAGMNIKWCNHYVKQYQKSSKN